jgi:hypothetical protein
MEKPMKTIFRVIVSVSLVFLFSIPLSAAGCIYHVYADPSGDIYYASNGPNGIATQNYQEYLDWVNANCH